MKFVVFLHKFMRMVSSLHFYLCLSSPQTWACTQKFAIPRKSSSNLPAFSSLLLIIPPLYSLSSSVESPKRLCSVASSPRCYFCLSSPRMWAWTQKCAIPRKSNSNLPLQPSLLYYLSSLLFTPYHRLWSRPRGFALFDY
jgi:hypothetical protein